MVKSGDSTVTTTPSNRRSLDESNKHPGAWEKKKYALGRHASGGFWTCCGDRHQISSPCVVQTRMWWAHHQREADACLASQVVKRAKAAIAYSAWQKMSSTSPHLSRTPSVNPLYRDCKATFLMHDVRTLG
mmetsp:Transcript_12323/g.37983  ORF Transcript_12323/g.37983 Transcript_12323/m.37983 type:complete len:131 (+) Transcript_12323:210-602(+)